MLLGKLFFKLITLFIFIITLNHIAQAESDETDYNNRRTKGPTYTERWCALQGGSTRGLDCYVIRGGKEASISEDYDKIIEIVDAAENKKKSKPKIIKARSTNKKPVQKTATKKTVAQKKVVQKVVSKKTKSQTLDVDIKQSLNLTTATNVRSSINFYGTENIVGQLDAGSSVYVYDRKKLASGAESLLVEVTAPENKVYLNEKKPLYIWQMPESKKSQAYTDAGTTCTTTCYQNNTNKNVSALQAVNLQTQKQDAQPTSTDTTKTSLSETTVSEDCPSKDKIDKYSNSAELKKTISWMKSHALKKPDHRCYRNVKNALAAGGNNLIPSWFASKNAYLAATDLLKYGFKNLLKCPQYKNEIITSPNINLDKIPNGAVLVYERPGKPGHTEIKFEDPDDGKTKYGYGYIANRQLTSSSLGSKYKLIGVMIKPEP